MMNRRSVLSAGSLAGLSALVPLYTYAQQMMPLAKVLVGFPPGGSADVIGRALAEKLRGTYAANVIVENKPGALGSSVMQALLSSEPDGSSIYLAPHSLGTLYPHLYPKLPYDPATDAIPVSVVGTFDFALSVANNVPVKTFAEFIEWCKANPSKAAYGSLGSGSSAHFIGFMISQATGVTWNHVPYKGAGPGVQDLLAGHIPSLIGPLGDVVPHHRAGKVRVIATSGARRSRFMPEAPTFDELGYKGMVVTERFGVYARKGTPAVVVGKLNRDVGNALRTEDFRSTLEKLSYEVRGSTPQEFDAMIKAETARWGPVVKGSGFTPDN